MTQLLLKNAGFMPVFEFFGMMTIGIIAGSLGII
jgi:hypothetical protein